MKKYVLKNWWRYLIGGIALITSTAIDVLVPLVVMSLVDEVFVAQDITKLPKHLMLLGGAALGRAISQYVKEYLCDMAGCNVAEDLRKDLMKHVMKLSKTYFNENNTGELMARIKDDAGRVWDLFGFVGMLMTEAILYFVFVVICMIRLNWKLSLIPLFFIPILAWRVMNLSKKLDRTYGQISEENAALTRVAEENISGVRTVKAFSAEEYELRKFDEKNSKYNDINIEQALDLAKAEPILHTLPKLMQGTVIVVGGIAAINGKITYGLLVAFMQYAGNIVWPIENMGWMLGCLSAGFTGLKKIRKIFKAVPQISECENPKAIEGIGETLEFKHVGFSLLDKTILNDISFKLEKGKTLGIMGATGTGKSTIVNLIERYYDVSEGEILIDGINIKDMYLEQLRSFSSVVTQDVFLFSDTIRENVKLGRKATMEDSDVRHALRKAHAQEFVDKITGGYDAVIGERGIGLSGGQKQRLSIARALARKSGVLILDDSTSALDMETESDIQKEIREKKDMSKIIIGHRISSVKDADEIIVLDNGTIAERGTHAELIAKKGLYFGTYEAQYGSLEEAMKVMAVEGCGDSDFAIAGGEA